MLQTSLFKFKQIKKLGATLQNVIIFVMLPSDNCEQI